MQCKKCRLELEQNQTVCPNCGENAEAEVVETEQMQELIVDEVTVEQPLEAKEGQAAGGKDQTLKAVLFAVLAAALLVALAFIVISGSEGGLEALFPTKVTEPTIPTGTIPQDGNPDDETCKGSYTQSDEILAGKMDTVVAQLGDITLTNGQLQVYYWTQVYSYYQGANSAHGPNYKMALDQQLEDPENGRSWQQYFLKLAIDEWKVHAILCQMAQKADFKMPEDQQEMLDGLQVDFIKNYIDTGKYSNLDEVIQSDMGAGCKFADYEAYMYNRYYAAAYYEVLVENVEITMEDMEAYFAEKEEALKEQNITKEAGKLVDVRHILIVPDGGTENFNGEITFDEEDWERCRQRAQALYDQWLAGDADEASFEKLAKEHSEDPGSKEKGGLYKYVAKGTMVKEFEDWCFDEKRQEGDTGLVKTEYGYHIMYYVCGDATWIRYAQLETPYWKLDNQVREMIDAEDITVRYEDIGLWYWIIKK